MRIRTATWSWVLVLGLAPAPGRTGGALQGLEQVAAALEAARTAGLDSAALEARIPSWAWRRPRFEALPPPPDPAGLRRILAESGPARLRALAALALVAAGDPADLDRLAPLAANPENAGPFPEPLYAAAVEPVHPVHWQPMPLGRVVLEALGGLAGRRFPSPEAYAAWRRLAPDPEDTLDWWKARSTALAPAARPAFLDRLATARPLVFARLELQSPPPAPDPADPAVSRAVAILAARLGPAGLEAVLLGETRWPELADEAAAGRARDRLLAWAPAIAGTAAPALLERLFEVRGRIRPEWVHERLALVLARLRPARQVAVLATVLDEKPRGQMGEALAALAAADPVGQAERLEGWFRDGAPSFRPGNRAAILAGLARAGPAARPTLARLVAAFTTHAEAEALAGELVAAARACGDPGPYPRLGEAVPVAPPRKLAMADEGAAHARDEARAQKARADCVARVRRFLGLAP